MAAYPTNPPWKCPITRSLVFTTGIAQGVNGTEQRWMLTPGVESWTLPYTLLSRVDRDTLLSTFEASKGAYDQTVSLLYAGTNYTGLCFDGDSLIFTEASPGKWSGSVKLSTSARTADSGNVPTDFPVLSSGVVVQLPFTHGRTFDTAVVRTEGGRFAYARRNASLRQWAAGGSAITTAEAQSIWDMFRFARGRWHSFGFTDPDSGTRYANCRFSADTCEWRVSGPNCNSVQVTIQQLP